MTKALARQPSIASNIAQIVGGMQVHCRLTKDEVNRARDAARLDGPRGLDILVDLLWFTGARISEAIAIRVQDFDVKASVIQVPTLKRRVPKGKGKRPPPPFRGIPIPDTFLVPLASWIVAEKLGPSDRLIKWHRTQAWFHVHRLLLSIGIEPERAKPKAFRHGHAMHAIHQGAGANVVKETLGHSNLMTTQVYVRAAGTDIQRAYRGIDWT